MQNNVLSYLLLFQIINEIYKEIHEEEYTKYFSYAISCNMNCYQFSYRTSCFQNNCPDSYSAEEISRSRSSHLKVFLRKGVRKICSKFTGEHPYRCNFIEVALRHGCSPVNLLHIFRTHFLNNTFKWLLLTIVANTSSKMLILRLPSEPFKTEKLSVF